MVLQKIREIIMQQLDVRADDINMDTCMKKDLGADSLHMIEIFMALEDAYDMDLPDRKLGTVVGDYVRYIENHIGVTPVEEESRKSA